MSNPKQIKSYQNKPIILFSSGDPGGIGPEVIVKALQYLKKEKRGSRSSILSWDFIPVIIGDFVYFEKLLEMLEEDIKVIKKFNKEEMIGAYEVLLRSGTGIFLDMDSEFAKPVFGKEDTANALASYKYFKESIELIGMRYGHGLVTAPVNKGAINKAGIPFAGHTEEFLNLIEKDAGDDDEKGNPYMLMYSKDIKVLLLTTHLPIEQIVANLDIEQSLTGISSAVEFVKSIDDLNPKIAMLGIDPHCGDQGAISNTDQIFTTKLIEELKKKSVNVDGPFSADSFFQDKNLKKYDLVVSAYHDQGLIPFKMLSFNSGVNVTLNIPLKRTSPDHGTAYELVGSGKADEHSMVEAIRLCKKWVQKG